MPRYHWNDWEDSWVPIGKKPIRLCSPEGDKTKCGREMYKIPYKRREEDVKPLNVYVCPSCDSYAKWPRNK